ncbi:MAG: hypothetical protein ACRDJG_09500 [Actinomycetota bacterium]
MSHEAVHHTILVTDIAGSGRQDRKDSLRARLRTALRQMMKEALEEAGVRWDDCKAEDRGDGVLLFVPSHVPKVRLLDRFVLRLTADLGEHNDSSSPAARLQLRLAAHAGEVAWDKDGAIGTDVNATFRLVNSEVLKTALAASGCDLAVIVSDSFYQGIRQTVALIGAHEYRETQVDVKEFHGRAWITLRPPRPEGAGATPPPPVPDRPSGGPPGQHTEGGVSFHGPATIHGPVTGRDHIVRHVREREESSQK